MVITITGSTFGRTSDQMIREFDMPDRRAASTNSRWAMLTVTPRMFRAKNGMLTTATAISAFISPGPSAATMASASRM